MALYLHFGGQNWRSSVSYPTNFGLENEDIGAKLFWPTGEVPYSRRYSNATAT